MTKKPWYQSKTLWFNLIMGILAVLSLKEFVAVLPPAALPFIALATAVGNVILRFITSQPLGV